MFCQRKHLPRRLINHTKEKPLKCLHCEKNLLLNITGHLKSHIRNSFSRESYSPLIIYPGERPSRYCAHRKTFSCIFLLSLQCNVISGIIFKRRGRHRKNEMQAQIFSDFSAKPMVLCHRFLNVFGGREMFQGKGP